MNSNTYSRTFHRSSFGLLLASLLFIDGCDSAGEVVGGIVGGIVAAVFSSTGSGAAGVLPILFSAIGVGYQPPNMEFSSEFIGMAITSDFSKVYMLDRAHDSVSVADLASREVIAVIDLGDEPNTISVAPSGQRAVVTTRSGIFVIDTATDAVEEVDQSMHTTSDPYTAIVLTSANKAYVGERFGDGITVVDIGSSPPVSLGAITGCNSPRGMTMTDGGPSSVYIACRGDNKLIEIDPGSDSVVREVVVDERPIGLALTPDGALLLAANLGAADANGSVSVIDTGEFSEASRVTEVVSGPQQVLVSDDGRRVFVAGVDDTLDLGFICEEVEFSGIDSGISVFELSGGTIAPLTEITGLNTVGGLAATGEGDRVFGFSRCSEDLYRLTEGTSQFTLDTQTFSGTTGSSAIALNDDGSELYLLHPHALSIVNPNTLLITDEIAGRGSGPMRLALSQDGLILFATLSGRNEVVAVDTVSSDVLWRQSVGSRPFAVEVGPLSSSVYVASAGYFDTPDDRLFQLDPATGQILIEQSDDDFTGTTEIEPIRPLVGLAEQEQVLVAISGNFTNYDLGVRSSRRAILSLWTPAEETVETIADFEFENSVSDFAVRRLADGSYRGISTASVLGRCIAFSEAADSGNVLGVDVGAPAYTALNQDATRGALSSFRDSNMPSDPYYVTLFDLSNALDASNDSTVPVTGPNPGDIEFSPDGEHVYVAAYNGNTIEVVGFTAAEYLGAIPVGSRPIKLAVNAMRNELLVISYFDNLVSIVTADGSVEPSPVIGTLATGRGPMDIVLDESGERAYIANSLAGTVTVLDVTGSGTNCSGGWCAAGEIDLLQ